MHGQLRCSGGCSLHFAPLSSWGPCIPGLRWVARGHADVAPAIQPWPEKGPRVSGLDQVWKGRGARPGLWDRAGPGRKGRKWASRQQERRCAAGTGTPEGLEHKAGHTGPWVPARGPQEPLRAYKGPHVTCLGAGLGLSGPADSSCCCQRQSHHLAVASGATRGQVVYSGGECIVLLTGARAKFL